MLDWNGVASIVEISHRSQDFIAAHQGRGKIHTDDYAVLFLLAAPPPTRPCSR